MNDEEFDAFLADAVAEVESKQEALVARWKLGSYDRFLFDQPTESLQFLDHSGRSVLRAAVLPIGSYSSSSGTWKWGWSNESLLEPLRTQGARLRELQAVTGMDLFGLPIFAADPEMPGEIAAMAVKHLGAEGYYRAPGPTSDLYLAITRVELVQGA